MTSVQPHSNVSPSASADASHLDAVRHDGADVDPGIGDTAQVRPAHIDMRGTEVLTTGFGHRLSMAREARGEPLDVCARAVHLSARVLRQLEAGSYDGTDSKIYLAGYISTYARYLGLEPDLVRVELDRIQQIEAPLVATGGISRSRFLLDRYATAATYVVLTAVIVVPMIWLGVRGTLDRDLSHLAPLDAAPVAQQDTRPVTGPTSGATATALISAPQIAQPTFQEQPLMASMAPFPNMDSRVAVDPSAAPMAAAVSGSGEHSLSLSLSAASWVEVVARDGSRMEYGLLPAGSSKTYHSDQPLDVRIGNASGAQLSIDGQAVALEDFQRANVARLRVQIEDGKATAANL